MPPPLALALTFALMAVLFFTEKDEGEVYRPSPALWIPTIWLFVLGSRSVTEWVSLGAPVSASGGVEEGSPIDRALFFVLIILGILAAIVCITFPFYRVPVQDHFLSLKNAGNSLYFSSGPLANRVPSDERQ